MIKVCNGLGNYLYLDITDTAGQKQQFMVLTIVSHFCDMNIAYTRAV